MKSLLVTLLTIVLFCGSCGPTERQRDEPWPPENLSDITLGECVHPGEEESSECDDEIPEILMFYPRGFCMGRSENDPSGVEVRFGPVMDHREFLGACCRNRDGAWQAMAISNNLRWGGRIDLSGTIRDDIFIGVGAEEVLECQVGNGDENIPPITIGGLLPADPEAPTAILSVSTGSGDDYLESLGREDGSNVHLTLEGYNDNDQIVGPPEEDRGYVLLSGGLGSDQIESISSGEIILMGDDRYPSSETNGDDEITVSGTPEEVIIETGGGNVRVEASDLTCNVIVLISPLSRPDNQNEINLGSGNDVVFGGRGDDVVYLGHGNDWFDSGGGEDEVYAGDGQDLVTNGGGGILHAYLGRGNDVALGGGGVLDAYGEEGDDILLGDYYPGCAEATNLDGSWSEECLDQSYFISEDFVDSVNGGDGEDLCQAEHEVFCEDAGDCGDGECTLGETCLSCSVDCGECPFCRDETCDPDEDCRSCPEDCGECSTDCGDTFCDPDENCRSCPDDCGICPFCRDETCDPDEDCRSCPEDCGPCPPRCGDETCNTEEDCTSCPDDCGECTSVCGDETCDPDEDCDLCPADCGECPPRCGDTTCDPGEECTSCPDDCGECPPVCGNEVCEVPGEDCDLCPADCGECPLICGDGVCDSPEDCTSCPDDCGECPPRCGDSICEDPEDCASCPEDCGDCPPVCGDEVCEDPGENCDLCPADCGECPPRCGDGICEDPEDCASCPDDCGACRFCGDGICDLAIEEWCRNCPRDCGVCASCGDGRCDGDDDCESCPRDCGICDEYCGNFHCLGDETCRTCPRDCGYCG